MTILDKIERRLTSRWIEARQREIDARTSRMGDYEAGICFGKAVGGQEAIAQCLAEMLDLTWADAHARITHNAKCGFYQ